MLKFLFFVLSLVAIIFISYPTQGIASKEKSLQYIDSVVKINYEISLFGHKNVVGVSTGFSVAYQDNKSYILSNDHFCKVINPDETKLFDERFFYESSKTIMSVSEQFETGEIEVFRRDPKNDLCLLVTKQYIPPVKLASNRYELQQADPVITIGAPNNVFPIITQTYFSGYFKSTEFEKELMMLSNLSYAGQSGSPVFNEKGEVLGVVVMNLTNDDGPIYGTIVIPVNRVKDFLKESSISF